ncbi:hypothetical protein TNIN_474461 [Trichonephila inaurata madagascariensis]|uniref:Uncharacterized protein n=1 Tax=Trichonephila inaurata madagascariensis TaxID=2747483 RepID=A0A8X6XP87_9ARAC|nr:hypothetical protein TNIN_474461 [Trichonephila inaurata madagascariensis]
MILKAAATNFRKLNTNCEKLRSMWIQQGLVRNDNGQLKMLDLNWNTANDEFLLKSEDENLVAIQNGNALLQENEDAVDMEIEVGKQKDSKGSSTPEDSPDQETIAQMKLVESTEEAAGHASNNENSITVIVAYILSTENTSESPSVESSDGMSTYSAEEAKKTFCLIELSFCHGMQLDDLEIKEAQDAWLED